MLWLKAFHVIFVASWFASMFYLPRILVNLAMVPVESVAERERLLGMGRRLYRFGSILMGVALVLGGVLMAMNPLAYNHPWMHAKLTLVVLAVGYHHVCRGHLRRFEEARPTRSHRWYRVFNEVSVLLFAAIVILVVVKPF